MMEYVRKNHLGQLLFFISLLFSCFPSCERTTSSLSQDDKTAQQSGDLPVEKTPPHFTKADLVGIWLIAEKPEKYEVDGYYFTLKAYHPDWRLIFYTLDGNFSTFLGLNRRNFFDKIYDVNIALPNDVGVESVSQGVSHSYDIKGMGRQITEVTRSHARDEFGEIRKYYNVTWDVMDFSGESMELSSKDDSGKEVRLRMMRLTKPYLESILFYNQKARDMNQNLIITYCEEQLKNGVETDSLVPFPERHDNVLTYAASKDYPQVADYLIKKGASIEGSLTVSLEYGSVETAIILLRADADVNILVRDGNRSRSFNPLIYAVKSGSDELVKLMLEKGAHPPVKGDADEDEWSETLSGAKETIRSFFR
jgi:hypothetical protein